MRTSRVESKFSCQNPNENLILESKPERKSYFYRRPCECFAFSDSPFLESVKHSHGTGSALRREENWADGKRRLAGEVNSSSKLEDLSSGIEIPY